MEKSVKFYDYFTFEGKATISGPHPWTDLSIYARYPEQSFPPSTPIGHTALHARPSSLHSPTSFKRPTKYSITSMPRFLRLRRSQNKARSPQRSEDEDVDDDSRSTVVHREQDDDDEQTAHQHDLANYIDKTCHESDEPPYASAVPSQRNNKNRRETASRVTPSSPVTPAPSQQPRNDERDEDRNREGQGGQYITTRTGRFYHLDDDCDNLLNARVLLNVRTRPTHLSPCYLCAKSDQTTTSASSSAHRRVPDAGNDDDRYESASSGGGRTYVVTRTGRFFHDNEQCSFLREARGTTRVAMPPHGLENCYRCLNGWTPVRARRDAAAGGATSGVAPNDDDDDLVASLNSRFSRVSFGRRT